jgi:hypothetical protein
MGQLQSEVSEILKGRQVMAYDPLVARARVRAYRGSSTSGQASRNRSVIA